MVGAIFSGPLPVQGGIRRRGGKVRSFQFPSHALYLRMDEKGVEGKDRPRTRSTGPPRVDGRGRERKGKKKGETSKKKKKTLPCTRGGTGRGGGK